MKYLGDKYVRNEFKQHKVAKPEYLKSFYQSWEHYVSNLKEHVQNKSFQSDLNLNELNTEQKNRIERLKSEIFDSDK